MTDESETLGVLCGAIAHNIAGLRVLMDRLDHWMDERRSSDIPLTHTEFNLLDTLAMDETSRLSNATTDLCSNLEQLAIKSAEKISQMKNQPKPEKTK